MKCLSWARPRVHAPLPELVATHSSVILLSCHPHKAFLSSPRAAPMSSSRGSPSPLCVLYLKQNKWFCGDVFVHLPLPGGDELLGERDRVLIIFTHPSPFAECIFESLSKSFQTPFGGSHCPQCRLQASLPFGALTPPAQTAAIPRECGLALPSPPTPAPLLGLYLRRHPTTPFPAVGQPSFTP